MLTQEELNQVMAALKANAKDASTLESVTTLDGVSSLPVVSGGTWKKVPLDMIKSEVGSTQPDWQQSDSTASDYVKNRTHYFSIGDATLDEDVYIISGEGSFSGDPEMEAGEYYMIMIDRATKLYGQAVEKDDGVAWPKEWVDGQTGWKYAINGKTVYAETGGTSTRNIRIYPLTFVELNKGYVGEATETDIDDIVV